MKNRFIIEITAIVLLICCMFIPVCAEDELMQEPESVGVPVIMYHSIYKKAVNEWTITPAEFEADMKYLSENGYHTIGSAELVDYVENNVPLPDKPIMLSFDDGCYNNYVYALPLLEEYDMMMVMSVIGESTEKWSEVSDIDERYGHLTWDQINEMYQTGRVELSNHTYSLHKNVKGRKGCIRKAGESVEAYRKVLEADVGSLQEILQEKCGVTPICFAYPFGSRCEEATEILKDMGFKVTLSCYEGMNYVKPGDPDSLYNLKRCERAPGRPIKNILKKIEK